jgi:hypothetical protein
MTLPPRIGTRPDWRIAHHGIRFGQYAAYATAWSRRAKLSACPIDKDHCRRMARMWAEHSRAALADLNTAMGA